MLLDHLRHELRTLANPQVALILQRFFKTAPGQYGHGDLFLGIKVPPIRKAIQPYLQLPTPQLLELLQSTYHEERLAALLILVHQFAPADPAERKRLHDLYLGHTRFINNWDLVDCSAPQIVGAYLYDKSCQPLYTLAKSTWLWDRRIAILATLHHIRHQEFTPTLTLAGLLLHDREDLIHKAVGWMLREVGKRDLAAEQQFLLQHYSVMPRTMLRYAIERFPPDQRRRYLSRRWPVNTTTPWTL